MAINGTFKISPLSQSIIMSVVIPCYNQSEYLLEAIASVEAYIASMYEYEIAIGNDGSNDATMVNVMHELEQQGYLVLSQENQRLAKEHNNGIEKSQGCYIMALDADDKIRPDYILKWIKVLDYNPNVSVVYRKTEWFGESQRSWDIPEKSDADRLTLEHYIDTCTVFRKSLWKDCGGYDPNIPLMGLEDWDLWLSAIEKGWNFTIFMKFYLIIEFAPSL